MTGNIFAERDHCARDCRTTWAIAHGPGHNEPGEYATAGDVRRCEHGKLWLYDERENAHRSGSSQNYWQRLYWFWYPILSWRATRTLKAAK